MTAAVRPAADTRQMLHAYEHPAPVLVAWIINDMGGGAGDGRTITRRAIFQRYRDRLPNRTPRQVDKRLCDALRLLEKAGIVRRDGRAAVTVTDPALLAMAAGNLRLMNAPDGTLLRWDQWTGVPAVPEELRAAQAVRQAEARRDR